MSERIQLRRGLADEWTRANPILAPGEMGVELDTWAWKIGDGAKKWSALGYGSGPPGATGPTGPAGPAGPQGIAGPSGPQGPHGPTGADGTVEVYEQPNDPGDVADGSIWIDTDAVAPTGPAGPQGPPGPPGGTPPPAGTVGDGVADDRAALQAAVSALSAGQTLDLCGKTYRVGSTLSINVASVTLRNGSIVCQAAATTAVQVIADSVTFRDLTITASSSRGTSWGATSAQTSACVINSTNFRSYDVKYSGGYFCCLLFNNGNCAGARVYRGSTLMSSLVQNSAGIQAAGGAQANDDIVIDGVEVAGAGGAYGSGQPAAACGVLMFDGRNCRVRRCHVHHCTRQPTLTISNGAGSAHGSTALWTQVGVTTIWQARLASGVNPGVDGPATDRNDGGTRVMKLDGLQVGTSPGGGGYNQTTNPAPGTWGYSGGYLYYNTSGQSFTDPNNHTFTSDTVSGYGITFYNSANGFNDPSGNSVEHNRIHDCDGFGVYMQAGNGDGTAGHYSYGSGNSTRGNDLLDCCLQGAQDTGLPFAAIGWNGGVDSLMIGDTIRATSTVAGVPGVAVIFGSGIYLSSGRIQGVTVDGYQHGFFIDADGGWRCVGCDAANITSFGFVIQPTPNQIIRNVELIGCHTRYCQQGVYVNGSAAGSTVQVDVIGGSHRYASNSSVYIQGGRECKVLGITSFNADRNNGGQSHIRITGNGVRHVVVHNHFAGTGGATVGIKIDAGCTDCTLADNYGVSMGTVLSLAAGVYVRTGGNNGGPINYMGAGVPTSGGLNIVAPIGSEYVNTAGSAGSMKYINTTGTAAGWQAIV